MKPIYLDNQATTPADPRVISAMQPYWMDDFGNPHSEGHPFGWRAHQAVEFARSQVADFIGADDDEIIFVSGATESCNLAIRGLFASSPSNERNQIVTLATEHAAVFETAQWLGHHGFRVDVLPVKRDGLLDFNELRSALSDQTLLVFGHAGQQRNRCHPACRRDILPCAIESVSFVHTDATQATGRIKIDVDDLDVDLLSLSGHKIYGPNGVGVLYVRKRPDLKLKPIMTGGTQEHNLRPGTVAVPLVVGMGEACAIANKQLPQDARRLKVLALRPTGGIEGGVSQLSDVRKYGAKNTRKSKYGYSGSSRGDLG